MIEIRTAVPSDAATLAEFQVLLARESEGLELAPPTVARGVRAVFDDPGKGAYYIAQEGGRVVGCLMITAEWSDWRDGTWWWIQSVYVVPEARRRGVFRRLYEHVRALVAASGRLCGLRLYVDLRNARAQKVYEEMGMSGEHYRMYEWDRQG